MKTEQTSKTNGESKDRNQGFKYFRISISYLLLSKFKMLSNDNPVKVCRCIVSNRLCIKLRLWRFARLIKDWVAIVWIWLFPKWRTCKAVKSSKRPSSNLEMWLLDRSKTMSLLNPEKARCIFRQEEWCDQQTGCQNEKLENYFVKLIEILHIYRIFSRKP